MCDDALPISLSVVSVTVKFLSVVSAAPETSVTHTGIVSLSSKTVNMTGMDTVTTAKI